MTRLDFDLSVFRLNSFLCRIGYSDFSFHFPRFFLSFFFIPARFSLFPFNWHLSFPSVRAFFHLFACLFPHTPPDFSVFSFSVVSHPPILRRCPRIRIPQAWNNPGKLNASLEVFLSTSVSAIDDFLISEIGHNAAKRAFFFEFLASPSSPFVLHPVFASFIFVTHCTTLQRYCSRVRIDRFFTPFILSSNKKFAIKQRRRICLLFAIFT